MAVLQELGFHAQTVSNKQYDLLVDHNNSFIRVQVKTCSSPDQRGDYIFNTVHGRNSAKYYTADEVDVFVFVGLDIRRCFFRPMSEVTTSTVRVCNTAFEEPDIENKSWTKSVEALK